MKFSVVIPLYNKALYIQRALDSVLSQKVQDFEIVVVDDGSTDNGADLVRGYTYPRIRLIQQTNAGVSAARNRGIAESNADLIAFLDADDKWDNCVLEQISFLTEKYPAAGLFATSYRMFNGIDVQYPQIRNLAIPVGGHGILKNYLNVMLGPPPFFTSSTVVKKEILQNVGCFPVGVAHGEDLDTWLQIYLHSAIAFLYSHPVVYFIGLPDSAAQGWTQETDFAPTLTAEKYINSGSCPSEVMVGLQEYSAYYELQIAKAQVFCGQHKQARRHLFRIKKTERYYYEKIQWIFWTFMPNVVTQTAFQVKKYFRQIRQFMGL
jgi:glycosyltransferase involved in cell wall biosynthesis